jgi:F0F1-type ATP synthase assembly protein I
MAKPTTFTANRCSLVYANWVFSVWQPNFAAEKLLPNSASMPHVMQELAPYMALGSHLAASVLVLGGIGWYADHALGSQPLWLIVGLTAGCVIGFVQFFRSVKRLLNSRPSPATTSKHNDPSGDGRKDKS